ncbi:hypothetical protein GH714_012806 [Hevea brasiliensis]|uniref:Uncharacterized protein n=1 Tax=Hevea brasiliensis TaxID=3981 RepID=A0A6A6NCG1_HEVBR|nr:hypothetical protein GH714_012806 [Hevea brasiliensis]
MGANRDSQCNDGSGVVGQKRKDFTVDMEDKEDRLMDKKFKIKWHFSSIYGQPKEEYKHRTFQLLRQHKKLASIPWHMDFRVYEFTWTYGQAGVHNIQKRLDSYSLGVVGIWEWGKDITVKIANCGRGLQRWKKETFRNINRHLKHIRDRMNFLQHQLHSEEEDIGRVFTSYFEDLFSSASSSKMATVLYSVDGRVFEQMNEQLIKPYTVDEILCSLKQMHPIKTLLLRTKLILC